MEYIAGKDGLVVLQGYRYIAPTALSFFVLAVTPGHRFALTWGYGYSVPSGTFSICVIAFLESMRSKIQFARAVNGRQNKRFIQLIRQ